MDKDLNWFEKLDIRWYLKLGIIIMFIPSILNITNVLPTPVSTVVSGINWFLLVPLFTIGCYDYVVILVNKKMNKSSLCDTCKKETQSFKLNQFNSTGDQDKN